MMVYKIMVIGLNPITGLFCTSKSGARVVGCYAQIASVLWYLGFEQHQQGLFQYSQSILLEK